MKSLKIITLFLLILINPKIHAICLPKIAANKISQLRSNCQRLRVEKSKHKNCALQIKGVQQFTESLINTVKNYRDALSLAPLGLLDKQKNEANRMLRDLEESNKKLSKWSKTFENNVLSFLGSCLIYGMIKKDLKKKEKELQQIKCPPTLSFGPFGNTGDQLIDNFTESMINTSCDVTNAHQPNAPLNINQSKKNSSPSLPLSPNNDKSSNTHER